MELLPYKNMFRNYKGETRYEDRITECKFELEPEACINKSCGLERYEISYGLNLYSTVCPTPGDDLGRAREQARKDLIYSLFGPFTNHLHGVHRAINAGKKEKALELLDEILREIKDL